MSRRIGFFEDFKGSDTVLLSISGPQAGLLALELEHFAASLNESHVISAEGISGHSATLVAVRESEASLVNGFRWLCGPSEVGDIAAKLRALGGVATGHQYFSLCGSRAQLMVSVGEYAY